MTKNTLIKLGSIGFAGVVVYGTYNFIQKNEKVLNFLTGKNELKLVEKNISNKNIFKTSNDYSFQKLENDALVVKNISTQNNISEDISIKKTSKPISTIESVTKKDTKTKSKRLNGKEIVRKNGFIPIG